MIDVENLLTLTACQGNKTSGFDLRTLEPSQASAVIQTEWFDVKIIHILMREEKVFYLVASNSPMTHLGMLSRRKVRTMMDIILDKQLLSLSKFDFDKTFHRISLSSTTSFVRSLTIDNTTPQKYIL